MPRLHRNAIIARDEEITRLRAEVENLRSKAAAFDEWHAKTEWVQETAEARELGMHRADVMRKRIEALRGQVAAKDLLLDGWMAANDSGWINALRLHLHAADVDVSRLQHEVEALKTDAPDAARFRWMRDNTTHESLPFPAEDGRWIVQFFPAAGGIHERNYKTLDAAINAARAAQGGEHD